jgi:hypothetical protein
LTPVTTNNNRFNINYNSKKGRSSITLLQGQLCYLHRPKFANKKREAVRGNGIALLAQTSSRFQSKRT